MAVARGPALSFGLAARQRAKRVIQAGDGAGASAGYQSLLNLIPHFRHVTFLLRKKSRRLIGTIKTEPRKIQGLAESRAIWSAPQTGQTNFPASVISSTHASLV